MNLYFGQVVWIRIDDGHGGNKVRPALILDSDEACRYEQKILVVAITKQIENPLPHYHFVVHDSEQLDSKTGLYYPCVAKCNWVREISRGRIVGSIGFLGDDILERIYNKFCDLQTDNQFLDWQ